MGEVFKFIIFCVIMFVILVVIGITIFDMGNVSMEVACMQDHTCYVAGK
jgi:hypothetical protein